jgi:hypothetical protein
MMPPKDYDFLMRLVAANPHIKLYWDESPEIRAEAVFDGEGSEIGKKYSTSLTLRATCTKEMFEEFKTQERVKALFGNVTRMYRILHSICREGRCASCPKDGGECVHAETCEISRVLDDIDRGKIKR